ncbi:MAG: transaldolase family protein, partial [Floccifex porci]|uniref:transaldolase family protein n=1 Tax=Floccifex porci TaxID=2606629 RepID=UPI003F0732F4
MHLGGIQMKLVIDSSDIQKIKELNELLTVAGVTTNPTIITKSGRPSEDVINDLI